MATPARYSLHGHCSPPDHSDLTVCRVFGLKLCGKEL